MSGLYFECVPNFSEGCRPEVWERLAERARASGARVLGAEGDCEHHRAVVTFTGGEEAIYQAVLAMADEALASIDLRRHRGLHPRMGAVDVVPVVPLGPTPMEAAVGLARRIGEGLARELRIPVYLYGEATANPAHRRLADARRGGFEGLMERMRHDPPDFGPAVPHPTAGATAVGARRILIAFNVYLATDDMGVARLIARKVRESSGGLPGVQALAMDTRERGRVQVSMNLVNYPSTPLPQVFARIRDLAAELGVEVAESELVGLMPLQALLDTAREALRLPALKPEQVIEHAIARWPWEK